MIIDKINALTDILIAKTDLFLSKCRKAINRLVDLVALILLKDNIYKLIRFTTFPWHWLWIWLWKYANKGKFKPDFFDEEAVHIIAGVPGSGKSTLAYEIANRNLSRTGKPFYINQKMEKPRVSEDNTYLYVYHSLYDFKQFFRDGKIQQKPNKMLFSGMVIDEFHKILNYRENRTNLYNSYFIPFSSYAMEVRKEIGKIFILTQMDKVDVQLMNVAKYIHVPQIIIGFAYRPWLWKHGIFINQPTGWNISTYSMGVGQTLDKAYAIEWKLKSEHTDWRYFDTYARMEDTLHIPYHYPGALKRVRKEK